MGGKTCNSSKPCRVPEEMEKEEKRDGSDGEKGVGGYRRGGTCHDDKPGLKCGND